MKPLFFTKEHRDYAFQHDFEYDESGFSWMVSRVVFEVYIDEGSGVGWNMHGWRYTS